MNNGQNPFLIWNYWEKFFQQMVVPHKSFIPWIIIAGLESFRTDSFINWVGVQTGVERRMCPMSIGVVGDEVSLGVTVEVLAPSVFAILLVWHMGMIRLKLLHWNLLQLDRQVVSVWKIKTFCEIEILEDIFVLFLIFKDFSIAWLVIEKSKF